MSDKSEYDMVTYRIQVLIAVLSTEGIGDEARKLANKQLAGLLAGPRADPDD